MSVVLALLLSIASPALAGVITCNDQVGELRGSLTGRLDSTSRDKLNEAARLCRENRNAEALELMRQVRAAVATQEPPNRQEQFPP